MKCIHLMIYVCKVGFHFKESYVNTLNLYSLPFTVQITKKLKLGKGIFLALDENLYIVHSFMLYVFIGEKSEGGRGQEIVQEHTACLRKREWGGRESVNLSHLSLLSAFPHYWLLPLHL